MGIQTYTIFGRQVGSHWLAIATLGSTAALATWGLSGGKKKEEGPQINASSKEEEQFIREFIKAAESEDTKVKAKH